MDRRQMSIVGAKAVAVRAFLEGVKKREAADTRPPRAEPAVPGARERARRLRQAARQEPPHENH